MSTTTKIYRDRFVDDRGETATYIPYEAARAHMDADGRDIGATYATRAETEAAVAAMQTRIATVPDAASVPSVPGTIALVYASREGTEDLASSPHDYFTAADGRALEARAEARAAAVRTELLDELDARLGEYGDAVMDYSAADSAVLGTARAYTDSAVSTVSARTKAYADTAKAETDRKMEGLTARVDAQLARNREICTSAYEAAKAASDDMRTFSTAPRAGPPSNDILTAMGVTGS